MSLHNHKFVSKKKAVLYTLLMIILCLTVSSASADDPRQTPVVKVVQENSSSVVNISTERIVLLREYSSWGRYGSEFDLFFEQFFNTLRPTHALKLKSVGSGVIIDKEGIVVTNAHVVNMASNIFVILNDGTSVDGKVMYEDIENDLAIVKIEPSVPLSQVKMAGSGDVIIGESVVAIGNPLGLENSVTLGIISGKNRSLHSSRGEAVFSDLIQTDAPINPGNSGGALLNLAGDLVGINVAVVQNSQSIGFAIPVEKVRKLLNSYEANRGLVVRQKKKNRSLSKFIQPKGQPRAQPQFPSNMDEWDPFSEFSRMRRQMDQMMRNMFDGHQWHKGMGMFNNDFMYDEDLDINDEGDRYVIKMDIAGLDRSKINIEINAGSITVSGERSEEIEKREENALFSSRSFGSFSRTFPIPEDVNTRDVETRTEGNTLAITLPKKSGAY